MSCLRDIYIITGALGIYSICYITLKISVQTLQIILARYCALMGAHYEQKFLLSMSIVLFSKL